MLLAADLLGQIPSYEKVASFTGDEAYDTQDVPGGAEPFRSTPPRKGAKLRKRLAFAYHNDAVGVQATGAYYLETVKWLPPKVTGGGEDDWPQAPKRESDDQDL